MAGIQTNGFKGPGEEVSRAHAGQRAVVNTYAILLREKAMWQRVAIPGWLCTMACVGIIIWMAGWGTRVVPHVVEWDRTGTERLIRPIPPVPQKAEQNVLRHIVTDWLAKTRAISSDGVVFQQHWDWVRDYTTSRGWAQIQEMWKEQAGRHRAGIRVQVQVREVLPVGGTSQSWAVEWEERAYTPEGRLVLQDTLRWKATLRVADFQDQAAKRQMQLMRTQNNYRNILGVFMDEVAFATPTPLEGP